MRRMTSRFCSIVAGVIVIATICCGDLHAGLVEASALKVIRPVNPSKTETADDYHIVVNDPAGAINIKSINKDGFGTETHSGGGTNTVTVDLFGGSIPPGGFPLKGIGVEFIQLDNLVRVSASYYTETDADGNHVRIGDAPVPGFQVQRDPVYTIYNDFDVSIGVRDLQFLVNVPEIPFDSLVPGSLGSFGTLTAPLPDFVLAPHTSLDISEPGLDAGNFLYAQYEAFDGTFTTEFATSIDGHQSPVPEPSAIALICSTAIVAIGQFCRRRMTISRNRSNSSH